MIAWLIARSVVGLLGFFFYALYLSEEVTPRQDYYRARNNRMRPYPRSDKKLLIEAERDAFINWMKHMAIWFGILLTPEIVAGAFLYKITKNFLKSAIDTFKTARDTFKEAKAIRELPDADADKHKAFS